MDNQDWLQYILQLFNNSVMRRDKRSATDNYVCSNEDQFFGDPLYAMVLSSIGNPMQLSKHICQIISQGLGADTQEGRDFVVQLVEIYAQLQARAASKTPRELLDAIKYAIVSEKYPEMRRVVVQLKNLARRCRDRDMEDFVM